MEIKGQKLMKGVYMLDGQVILAKSFKEAIKIYMKGEKHGN